MSSFYVGHSTDAIEMRKQFHIGDIIEVRILEKFQLIIDSQFNYNMVLIMNQWTLILNQSIFKELIRLHFSNIEMNKICTFAAPPLW